MRRGGGGTAYTRVEEGADRDNIQRDSKFIGPLNEAKRATDCRTFCHRLSNHSRTSFFFFFALLSFRFSHVRSVVAEKSGQVTRLDVSKWGGGRFAGRNAARLVSAAGGNVGSS